MKIRTGLVSNSSSSSFCVLGYETNLDSVMEAFGIKLKKKWKDIDVDDRYDHYEKIETKISEQGFNLIVDSDEQNEDNPFASIGVNIDGFNVGQIVELACQPDEHDKMSILREKMNLGEPTVLSGEYNF